MEIRKSSGIEFETEGQLSREIYWKIYRYQDKVVPGVVKPDVVKPRRGQT